MQARTEFAAALNQIASEKGVEVEVVLDAIRKAALAAYRKDLTLRNELVPDNFDDFKAEVNPISGEISIFNGEQNVTPPGFARIAASIAKQVILQRLYEAEKGAILKDYGEKVGTIISGLIQRQEGNTYFVDLGRAEGVLPPSEQVRNEIYHTNQRMKFLIKEIREGGRGPEVVVSRTDSALVKGLFALEVPEIQSGSVEIKTMAREAGSRTKIAALSHQSGVDPVGSLVGQKGVRVQAVMSELGDEKIDIIPFSEDPAHFIAAALSPAKDVSVKLAEKDKVATVKIPSSQLSLAIGKGGQNVRLAAKLTGWKIDIEGTEEAKEEVSQAEGQPQPTPQPPQNKKLPDETTSEESEMAEATNPEESVAEAVVKAAEENITEAEQDEYKNSKLEEPSAEEPQAAADAEADIEAEDKSEGKTEKERLKAGLGSPEETEKTEEGGLLAFDRPDEKEAPTVANTSETPDVSKAEPKFPKNKGEKKAKS